MVNLLGFFDKYKNVNVSLKRFFFPLKSFCRYLLTVEKYNIEILVAFFVNSIVCARNPIFCVRPLLNPFLYKKF